MRNKVFGILLPLLSCADKRPCKTKGMWAKYCRLSDKWCISVCICLKLTCVGWPCLQTVAERSAQFCPAWRSWACLHSLSNRCTRKISWKLNYKIQVNFSNFTCSQILLTFLPRLHHEADNQTGKVQGISGLLYLLLSANLVDINGATLVGDYLVQECLWWVPALVWPGLVRSNRGTIQGAVDDLLAIVL